MSVDLGPFANLDPCDGYRMQLVRTPVELSLHVCVYQGGRIANVFDVSPEEATIEVATYMSSPINGGCAVRLNLLMEAVCRYFTTGGAWQELEDVLRRARPVLRGGAHYDGYHYHDGYLNTAGEYEHVFAHNDGGDAAVVWVEGNHGFIDTASLAKLGEL